MSNKLIPNVDQWYCHRVKGQSFYVTAVDRDENSIEVQHFDGDLEEYSFGEWHALDLETCEPPENWSGPLDVGDPDDYGTEVTDTRARDWQEPENPYPPAGTVNERDSENDDYGEGHMEEDSMNEELEQQGSESAAPAKRPDGVYEESFDDSWYAEYSEDPQSGLWRVDLYRHDVAEWRENDYDSLDEAREAARNYYAQA